MEWAFNKQAELFIAAPTDQKIIDQCGKQYKALINMPMLFSPNHTLSNQQLFYSYMHN